MSKNNEKPKQSRYSKVANWTGKAAVAAMAGGVIAGTFGVAVGLASDVVLDKDKRKLAKKLLGKDKGKK
jgi:hypothetical protein